MTSQEAGSCGMPPNPGKPSEGKDGEEPDG
jgi:hypothetical protein